MQDAPIKAIHRIQRFRPGTDAQIGLWYRAVAVVGHRKFDVILIGGLRRPGCASKAEIAGKPFMDVLKKLFEQHFHSPVERVQPLQGQLGGSGRKIIRLASEERQRDRHSVRRARRERRFPRIFQAFSPPRSAGAGNLCRRFEPGRLSRRRPGRHDAFRVSLEKSRRREHRSRGGGSLSQSRGACCRASRSKPAAI